MSEEVIYVSWDPGTTTGYALWGATGDLISKGKVGIKDLHRTLQIIENVPTIKKFIAEDFRLFRHKAHELVGSRFEVARALGAIEFIAAKRSIEIVYQSPSTDLKSGLKFIGKGHIKGHVPDDVSAEAHGELYLVKNKIKVHRLLRES